MAYALLKGVRLGFLSESYRAYGEKAFHGICDNYLSTDENGNLHLGGICLVEWSRNIAPLLPERVKRVRIKKIDENTREIEY